MLLTLGLSNSRAQEDKMMFNHMSLGITAGLDGAGVEVVFPATDFLQLRCGYSFIPVHLNGKVSLGTFTLDDDSITLSDVPVNASIWKGGMGNLMLDIYPSRTGSFHFVAGVYAGPGKLIGSKVDARGYIEPEHYKTGLGRQGVSCSTDGEGFIHLDAAVMKAMPYLGLGFGRALNPDSRVCFNFELGAAYSGGIKLVAYDYSNPNKVTTSVLTSSVFVTESGNQLDGGIIDKLARFPVLPMFKFGLYVRLF